MSEKIEYPPRVKLANTPTPLDMLGRMSDKLGVELYVKRDDLTGVELSGNKVRKLEFAFAEAINNGADTVLTCGGVQSNHARATAIAAVKLGLNSRLILRVSDPSNPPSYEGNSLLDKLAGADIVWVTPDEYENRGEIFEREADLLRKIGQKPYIIPEGASNSIGAWGYIRAVEELARDLDDLSGGRDKPTTIINAAGSGGTSAGLILGVLLFGLNVNVVSVNVCNDKDYFVRVIGDICEKTIANYSLGIPFLRDRDINIIDGYVGKGYAISRPEELNLIRDVARTEGIVLDPVYTGKAFFGMLKELERKPRIFGDRIIFIHTGGIFGLFPKAGEMSALL